MCLIAINFQVVSGCPILIAANREEIFNRQGTPPEFWPGDPAIVAGRDPRAGGTWLGVNSFGVLVAISNRPKRLVPERPRSRGLLCRDLLGCASAAEVHDRAVRELGCGTFAGCNVVAADASAAFVVHSGDAINSRSLEPGVHIVTNADTNDPNDPRIVRVCDWIAARGKLPREGWLRELPSLCCDHGDDGPPICLHAADRGTVSSSIIAIAEERDDSRWMHAQGPPCRNEFTDCSHLLAALGL